jgi:hypothetical protein
LSIGLITESGTDSDSGNSTDNSSNQGDAGTQSDPNATQSTYVSYRNLLTGDYTTTENDNFQSTAKHECDYGEILIQWRLLL